MRLIIEFNLLFGIKGLIIYSRNFMDLSFIGFI